MRSRIITDFINLFLRFSSLAGRFLLIFLITKFLSIEDLGVFGIINTSIALGVFLIGFEYHNYHTRKLLQIEFSEVPSKVRDQFGFHLVCYILIIPILYLFFISELIPSYLFFLFALVLFLEHMGQEIYRILLAFGNIIEGNIVLFIRSAVWVLVLLIYWMDSETVPNLNHLFLLWSFGALISLTLGLFWMHRNNLINFNTGAMDINWILNGIKVSKFFFISSLSFKIVEYSDRFFIDHFLGKEEVGVFTFYSGVSKVIQIAVFTVVTMVYYPLMVSNYQNSREKFKYFERQMLLKTLWYCIGILTLLFLTIDFILIFFDKKELIDSINVFWWLLAGQVLLVFSYIPHYNLYCKGKDSVLMYSTVSGAVICITFNYLLIPIMGITGAAIAGLLGFLSIFIMKTYYSLR